MSTEGRLDPEGYITVRLTQRQPEICGQFITLYNFGPNQYFHLTSEQFVELVKWGQVNEIEKLAEKNNGSDPY